MSSPEMRKRYVVAFPKVADADAWQEISVRAIGGDDNRTAVLDLPLRDPPSL